jgi:hypothetical protein
MPAHAPAAPDLLADKIATAIALLEEAARCTDRTELNTILGRAEGNVASARRTALER